MKSFKTFLSESNQELLQKAKELIGTTQDIDVAGFIMPDGSLLKLFQGKHYDTVAKIKGLKTGDYGDLVDFLFESGAIRILSEKYDINMMNITVATKPTQKQYDILFDALVKLAPKSKAASIYIEVVGISGDTKKYDVWALAQVEDYEQDIKKFLGQYAQ